MKKLEVPFLYIQDECNLDIVQKWLDELEPQVLDHLLWSTNGYKPLVTFTMVHDADNIYLKYKVAEDYVTAVHKRINDPVYKDTCVEFFLCIGNDTSYYNLEFNRLGISSVGYGADKLHRSDLPVDAIELIKHQADLMNARGEFAYQWCLTLIIPKMVFVHHPGVDLSGLSGRVNFYKCGDDLPQPHFLAWNAVRSKEPNFHLSEYFGDILFLTEGENRHT